MANSGVFVLVMLLVLSFGLVSGAWYNTSKYCPNAEIIIRQTVNDHFNRDPTLPAGVLRLHFHDCFVDGCDGSLLLDSTPTDGDKVEKNAFPNANSLRGFEVIDDAKTRLEMACPGVVSCADTLAMAARDSSVLLGGAYYKVPCGRYDGRVSSAQNALYNLPSPHLEADKLKEMFGNKGLSEEDLVVLSGGHTIGKSKCTFFQDRLYNFNNTEKPDPRINPWYLTQLQNMCPRNFSSSSVELDRRSQFRFDNSYYQNLAYGNGILTSDQTLASGSTWSLVQTLARDPKQFANKFATSMIKMGNIGWKTQSNGEIRLKCRTVNDASSKL